MKPARCPGAGRLIDRWWDTDLYRNRDRGMPDGLFECPPCTRHEAHQWLVVAGTCHSVITAGCPTAAKTRMAHVIQSATRPRRRSSLIQRAAQMTARAATETDLARWRQMLDQAERTPA